MAKGDAPSAPDPYTSAGAQYQYGTAAADYNAALNRVNTSTPTGSTKYQVTGYDPQTGAPIYSQNTTLAPAQQQLLNQSQTLQSGQLDTGQTLLGQFNDASKQGAPNINPVQYSVSGGPIQKNIDSSGVPGIADVSGLYDKSYSTALAGEHASIDPSMTQEKTNLDASLRNSGSHPGDAAYDNAMAALDARQANANTQAAGAAVSDANAIQNTNYGESANTNQQLFSQAATQQQAGNAAQGQDFSQQAANASLNNTAGQTALAEWAQKLGLPLNELQSILGGSQVQTPQAVAPGQSTASTPDIMSAFTNQYNGQLASYNADVASSNAAVGDAASLAALAFMASDIRVKKNIERVGRTSRGFPLYRFHYLGESDAAPRRLGVMAQDVEPVLPGAVITLAGGLKLVDYAQVGEF